MTTHRTAKKTLSPGRQLLRALFGEAGKAEEESHDSFSSVLCRIVFCRGNLRQRHYVLTSLMGLGLQVVCLFGFCAGFFNMATLISSVLQTRLLP
jgi:hypothetical protein